jgi:hypothetical protein
MATTPTYPTATGPTNIGKRIIPSDTTTLVDVVDNSAGTSALRIDELNISTNNSADRVVSFWLYGVSDSTNADLIGSVTVPDLSGSNGATDPRVAVLPRLGTVGADGVPCLWVEAGKKLQASVDAAIAADKILYITGRKVSYA